jgi:hypothetical protein
MTMSTLETPRPSTASGLLLDHFMPLYDVTVVHSGVFRVPPTVCYEAVLSLDVFEAPLIRALIDARGAPMRLAGIRGGRHPADEPLSTFRIRDMPQRGWLLLGETADVEMVLGLVGQPWKLSATAPSTPVTPESFTDFHEPGFLKIATSVRVDPYGSGSTILVVETRAVASDPESRRRFMPYWRVVGPFSHLIRWKTMRMLERRLNDRPS